MCAFLLRELSSSRSSKSNFCFGRPFDLFDLKVASILKSTHLVKQNFVLRIAFRTYTVAQIPHVNNFIQERNRVHVSPIVVVFFVGFVNNLGSAAHNAVSVSSMSMRTSESGSIGLNKQETHTYAHTHTHTHNAIHNMGLNVIFETT